jgi:hypothetical protein
MEPRRHRGPRRATRAAGTPRETPPASGSGQAAESDREQEGHEATPADVTQTRDDLDVGWGERAADPSGHDAWLQAQRPPHWE